MTPAILSPYDMAIAAGLVLMSAGLTMLLSLRMQRSLLIAAVRLVVQLLLVGSALRLVFRTESPAVTLLVVLVMMGAAAYEVGSRQQRRLEPIWHYGIGGGATAFATTVVSLIGLTTTLRPHPWFDARSAIPLTGLILGNVMNASSLTLNALLGSVARERAAIEARLILGATRQAALQDIVRQSVRTALIPAINSMSAAGVITMPGIMTGQMLAGMDPMNAAKYQIVLMFINVTGAVLASILCAKLAVYRLTDERERLRLDKLTFRRAYAGAGS